MNVSENINVNRWYKRQRLMLTWTRPRLSIVFYKMACFFITNGTRSNLKLNGASSLIGSWCARWASGVWQRVNFKVPLNIFYYYLHFFNSYHATVQILAQSCHFDDFCIYFRDLKFPGVPGYIPYPRGFCFFSQGVPSPPVMGIIPSAPFPENIKTTTCNPTKKLQPH